MIEPTSSSPELALREIDALIQEAKPGAREVMSNSGEPRSFVASASPLSVAIDGAGLFVFQNGAKRTYGRGGAFHLDQRGVLSDADGRAVMGFRLNEQGGQISGLLPIAVPGDAFAARRFSSFAIDANGTFAGIEVRVAPRSGKKSQTTVPIARIALAIFDAPERLAGAGATAVRETQASGTPRVFAPGESNVGSLRPHAIESGVADLQDEFKRLWLLRRRAELQNAMASATDRCVRTAIDLVK